MVEVGDKIRILYVEGEPQYEGIEGVVELIDHMGLIYGSFGNFALIPEIDLFTIVEKKED